MAARNRAGWSTGSVSRFVFGRCLFRFFLAFLSRSGQICGSYLELVEALCYKPEGRGFDSLPAALMALGSTQPLTERSTKNHPGGKGRSDCA
jgi:hypothetical protein